MAAANNVRSGWKSRSGELVGSRKRAGILLVCGPALLSSLNR
jgi:hypothetical protein